jgi:outer membrane protein OmpA-like peptidoglycan-associated protein
VALTLSQESDFAYKVFGGYQFDDNWAAEFFWTDMGQAEISSQSTGNLTGIVEYQSFGVGALYQYPLSGSWDVFATAGLGRLSNSFQLVDAERVEDSFIYAGAGVMWNLANTWNLRAEYDYYDTDAQMLSLNIVKRFGSATQKSIVRLEQKVQQQEAALLEVEKQKTATVVSPVVKSKNCDDFVVELKDVEFAARSIELNDKARKSLDEITERLLNLPEDVKFEVRAHTDDVGTELYNYSLSLARARNVRDYLSTKGIALSRIDAQGYGEWRPKQSNQSDAGRESNRRAELVLIGVEKYVENTTTCPELATPTLLVPR